MDRNFSKTKNFPTRIKSEIKTEIKTEDIFTNHVDDNPPQYYQQSIVKEEVMLPSDSEHCADESELISQDDKESHDNCPIIENSCGKRKAPTTQSTKLPKPDEENFEEIISKYGRATCNKCHRQSRLAMPRKNRCKLCDGVYRYGCSTCLDTDCKSFSSLVQHLRQHHTAVHELYTCPTCAKSFKLQKRLREHTRVCGTAAGFKCESCPYAANYKCNLVNHVRNKHGARKFNCRECGKRYTHERSLRRHARYYCGKKKSYKCEHCRFKAFRKDQMVTHLRLKHSKIL